jgi:hypothetical protein
MQSSIAIPRDALTDSGGGCIFEFRDVFHDHLTMYERG